jgi:hypothetical protein
MTATDVEPSNASTAGLGALSCLPLFRRGLPLPCVIICRFLLPRAAGRCTVMLSGSFFIRRVAQRGQFALRIGRVGVGRRWGYAFT